MADVFCFEMSIMESEFLGHDSSFVCDVLTSQNSAEDYLQERELPFTASF